MGKGWTEERRQKQAERIRQTRPWEKSTGPKTKGGKDRSKYNAMRHAKYSAKSKKLCAALQEQRKFLNFVLESTTPDPAFEWALNELRKNRLESIQKILEKISAQQTEGKSLNEPKIKQHSSPDRREARTVFMPFRVQIVHEQRSNASEFE